ncbi:MAG: hypothetical protein AB7F89_16245, partial [Pirellulaceae bacterium]
MRRILICLVWLLLTGILAGGRRSCLAQEVPAEPWRAAYEGSDAQGPHVIGYWRFESGDAARDSGPHRLPGRLDGAVAVAGGRFGGGLESFPGWPVEDKHHALVVAPHPSLSPRGAFTAEMWIKAKPEFNQAGQVYLLDKKYASEHDFQWLLGAPSSAGQRAMLVQLGFGTDSESFPS